MPTKTKNVMLVLHRWQDQPLSFPPVAETYLPETIPSQSCTTTLFPAFRTSPDYVHQLWSASLFIFLRQTRLSTVAAACV